MKEKLSLTGYEKQLLNQCNLIECAAENSPWTAPSFNGTRTQRIQYCNSGSYTHPEQVIASLHK